MERNYSLPMTLHYQDFLTTKDLPYSTLEGEKARPKDFPFFVYLEIEKDEQKGKCLYLAID